MAIARAVQQVAPHEAFLKASTLYPVLRRLVGAGWLREVIEVRRPGRQRHWRYYTTTLRGEKVLAETHQRRQALARYTEGGDAREVAMRRLKAML
jgi:DNA-binding PadR family transcriptional regulator